MTDLPTPWQDTEPLTVAEIVGEDTWQHPKRTDWIARQRTEALIRERGRRVDAQESLRSLVRAVEAHRVAVAPRGRPEGRQGAMGDAGGDRGR